MSSSTLPKAKVLVVDDEPSNVRLLERMLELFGGLEYRCTVDPRVAVKMFIEFQPDLVLTDLHMPHIDGYQLMSQLRQLIPEDSFLPIVVLTADITAETRRKALASGASDFITKPLDTTEVQLRIRNLLENRFLNARLEEQVRARTAQLENALEQLRNAQEQVVKQERLSALGMMAGGIAHDFNNTLTMLLGYGELLLPWFNKHAPIAKEKAYITYIVQAAKDASHVVGRLRDFYRPTEKGDVRAPVCLSELCEQVTAFTAPKWRGAGNVQVQTELTEVPLVLANAAELREVLTNLVFNAVDAMPKGGTITVRTVRHTDTVRIEIADTGIGMTPDEKARCLEPFFTTKGSRGTGLGLAVAYGIIQRHNGSIEIDSEKGRGTTFSICLPITDQTPEENQAADPTVSTRPLRILVVDDQEIICELIAEHLRGDGHEVTLALDGPQALSQFNPQDVDLVITDQSMPGMSGLDLSRAIKERSISTKVILLTGFGEGLEGEEKTDAIDAILAKPVSSSDLRRAIYEVAK